MTFTCVGCGSLACSADCYPNHAGQYSCHNKKCCYHRATVILPTTPETPRALQTPLESFSISKIEPGLFVGDLACVESEACLRFHNITAVVSVMSRMELPPEANISRTHPLKAFAGKNRLTIRAQDIKSTNLLKELPDACAFISKHLSPLKPWIIQPGKQGTAPSSADLTNGDGDKENHDSKPAVLIHCRMGVSRSATVAIGYLMWKYGKGRSVTMEKVRHKRPCIRPNPSFLQQLSLWGRLDYKLWEDTQRLVPKEDYVVLMDQLEAYKGPAF